MSRQPSASASELRVRTKQRLDYITRLIGGRCTLDQHRELLVTAAWLALLLGCLHYDLAEREKAEAAWQAAYHAGLQAGHGEIVAWSYELAAWFALTEGRYQDVADYARAGQQPAGLTSAMVQLVLQQARGQARLGERREVHAALDQGAKLLEGLLKPEHPENHFVFHHTKWIFYAADCYTCHQADYARTAGTSIDHFRAGFGTDCKSCHFPTRFKGARFAGHDACFQLSAGPHAGISCFDCHTTLTSFAAPGTCMTNTADCMRCHACAHETQTHARVGGFQCTNRKCYECHTFTAGTGLRPPATTRVKR